MNDYRGNLNFQRIFLNVFSATNQHLLYQYFKPNNQVIKNIPRKFYNSAFCQSDTCKITRTQTSFTTSPTQTELELNPSRSILRLAVCHVISMTRTRTSNAPLCPTLNRTSSSDVFFSAQDATSLTGFYFKIHAAKRSRQNSLSVLRQWYFHSWRSHFTANGCHTNELEREKVEKREFSLVKHLWSFKRQNVEKICFPFVCLHLSLPPVFLFSSQTENCL